MPRTAEVYFVRRSTPLVVLGCGRIGALSRRARATFVLNPRTADPDLQSGGMLSLLGFLQWDSLLDLSAGSLRLTGMRPEVVL